MTVAEQVNFSTIINELYAHITRCVWLANGSDGQTVTSKQFPDWKEIPSFRKERMVAARLKVESNTYTITRKVNGEIQKGFFYYLEAGRKAMMSKYNTHIPFCEQRLGCVYNSWGDAKGVLLDHMGFVREIRRRVKRIEKIFKEREEKKRKDPRALDDEIVNILYAPVDYEIKVIQFEENIASRFLKPDGKTFWQRGVDDVSDRIPFTISKEGKTIKCVSANVARFGQLDTLEEVGTPPLVLEDIPSREVGVSELQKP